MVRIQRKGNPYTLLMGTYIGSDVTENSMVVASPKLKIGLPYDVGAPCPFFTHPEIPKSITQRNVCMFVFIVGMLIVSSR